jgi:hypothetical protein
VLVAVREWGWRRRPYAKDVEQGEFVGLGIMRPVLIIPSLCQLERISALALNNPEVPNVKIGKPSEFFDSIASKTRNGRDLATWRGELYFELHRGVSRG